MHSVKFTSVQCTVRSVQSKSHRVTSQTRNAFLLAVNRTSKILLVRCGTCIVMPKPCETRCQVVAGDCVSCPSVMPAVDISTSGIGLPASVVRSGLSDVQSFVLHPKFVSNDLLTVECLEELKVNLPVGHQFLARASFDVCAGVSRHAWRDVFESLLECYNAYYSGQVEEWRSRMLAGSSRGECSGTASGADTISLAEASGSGQVRLYRRGKGVRRKVVSRGNLVETFIMFIKLIDLYFDCFL